MSGKPIFSNKGKTSHTEKRSIGVTNPVFTRGILAPQSSNSSSTPSTKYDDDDILDEDDIDYIWNRNHQQAMVCSPTVSRMHPRNLYY